MNAELLKQLLEGYRADANLSLVLSGVAIVVSLLAVMLAGTAVKVASRR